MNISELAKNSGRFLNSNSPAIMMGLSIAGVLTTAWLTHKATQRAARVIDSEEAKDLTTKEKIALTWKCYLPPLLSCGATVGLIVAGNSVQFKRQAALATAVSLSDTALSEYREKVTKSLGKTKDEKVRGEVLQDKVNAAGDQIEKIVVVGTGDVLCFDSYTGRPFVSTAEKIHQAANEIGRQCINDDYASQNEFYSLIGLPHVDAGEVVGWNNANPLEIQLGAVNYEGKPVLSIDYRRNPIVGFANPW